jgi:hypothetical protein
MSTGNVQAGKGGKVNTVLRNFVASDREMVGLVPGWAN